MNVSDSRDVLSHFLKTCRGRLKPQDVGLPVARSRRVTGLRREEVAALAGVGNTWYGLFESGKQIRVSSRVLVRIGDALRMSDDERRYLQSLVADAQVSVDFERAVVSDAVLRTLHVITSAPAFVIGPRLDYLAINEAANAIYRFDEDPTGEPPNALLHMFVDGKGRQFYPNWEETAARVTSKFRRNYANNVGNDSFERLIELVRRESKEFRELWELHNVVRSYHQFSDAIIHPSAGHFHYQLQAFDVPDAREQALFILLPIGPQDDAVLQKALALRR
jgi:hypothetical protein